MATRNLPGLGLVAYFPKGSDNWNDDMDQNLRLLSILVQAHVLSMTAALPANPPNGQVYIVPHDGGTYANAIAARDAGGWAYITPQKGWQVYVEDAAKFVYFDGTGWADTLPSVPQTDSMPVTKYADAARTLTIQDAGSMLVYTGNAPSTLTVPASASVAFPVGTQIIAKWFGAGPLSIAGEAGVTFDHEDDVTTALRIRGSEVCLTYLGNNLWDLVGGLTAKA
jgi:hypothetical protein